VHTDAKCDLHTYANCYGDSDIYAYSYTYANTECDTNSHGDSYEHAECYTNSYRKTYSTTKASPDSGATADTLGAWVAK